MELKRSLARGRTINFNNRNMWIPIKYEKLLKICYKCGKIWHGEQGCDFGSGFRNQCLESEEQLVS